MDMVTAGNLAEGTVITNVRYVVPGEYTSGEEFGHDYWAAVDYARAEWAKTWTPEKLAEIERYSTPEQKAKRRFVWVDVRATLTCPDRKGTTDLPISREKVAAEPSPGEEVTRRFAAERLARSARSK